MCACWSPPTTSSSAMTSTSCWAGTATRRSTAPRPALRRTDEALSLFDGIHGAIMVSEPETDEMLDSAAHLKAGEPSNWRTS